MCIDWHMLRVRVIYWLVCQWDSSADRVGAMLPRERNFASRMGLVLPLAILCVAAFLSRLLPLSISQYPFNNDSMTEIGIASEILRSSHLHFSPGTPWFGTHSTATPIFNVMIAFLASAFGLTPYQCGQVLVATLSVTTVGVLYLLGRLFSGNATGGIVAALMGIMMGTFVFTTGSVWKEALGMSLLALAVLAFVLRSRVEFRLLNFAVLMVLPFVHHLVAVMTLLVFSFLVCWILYLALVNGTPKRRCVIDLVMVLPPVAVVGYYYSLPSFDRTSSFLSPMAIALFFAGFLFLNIVMALVLSMKKHSKRTFAPFVGLGLFILVLLDYSGYIFPYSPSASGTYLLLAASSAFVLSLAWYGAEIAMETKTLHRAVLMALAISPIAVLGFVLASGFTLSSQKLFYRSFDFIDFFIFLGAAVGMVALRAGRRRIYPIISAALVLSLAVSFPFAYETGNLLGVRHDTQGYEIDAVEWIRDHAAHPKLISDERIGYIGLSVANLTKYSSLPHYLSENFSIDLQLICLIEDSWTTEGVNDYPFGKFVLSESRYDLTLMAADVYYLGGPASDRLIMFSISEFGSATFYPHS